MQQPRVEPDRPGAFTRRSLMAGTAAGAVGVSVAGALAGRGAVAQAAPPAAVPGYALPSGNYRIDLHCHFFPPEFVSVAQSHHIPLPSWSADAHIAFMNRWGIDASVVSLGLSINFGDPGQTSELARAVNEAGRQLIDAHGDRFGVLVTLPLPDLDASLAELAYALDTLKLDNGVLLLSHYNGVYQGDPTYEPLYQELDRRGCVVWLHPDFPPVSAPPFPGIQGAILEYPFETTRAATNLIFQDVLPSYPNIRWQLSHVGGSLPFLLYRIGSLYGIPQSDLPLSPQAAELGPFVFARKFYYDTAATGSKAQLEATKEFVDTSNFVFGTDWPWTGELFADNAAQRWPWFVDFLPSGNDPDPALSEAFVRPDRLRLERNNALALYPGVAARI
jgi:6-methylsalicylate decarboxylase